MVLHLDLRNLLQSDHTLAHLQCWMAVLVAGTAVVLAAAVAVEPLSALAAVAAPDVLAAGTVAAADIRQNLVVAVGIPAVAVALVADTVVA